MNRVTHKPDYGSILTILALLSRYHILWIMTASPVNGDLAEGEPAWLTDLCLDRGLVAPGNRPGTWRLSLDGWSVWRTLTKG